ncbi:MAG: hypothetical protein ACR2NB_04135 [Solirubrobacteraceae bacterium]
MRFRRLPRRDPAVVSEAAGALAAAEHELAAADAAHRSVYAAEVARWAEVARFERPPEDVRTALARQAAADAYERLVVARAAVERGRRAYHDVLREGAR